jgi:peptidoglycan/xylan/chitin deacetylase (PgdA/CDA1 family)
MSHVLVLMYHQVDAPRTAQEQRFCTPPAEFAEQMRWLVAAGYRGVSLDQVLDHVAGRRVLPEPSVHITFDDGFVGVLDHALPTLQGLGLPATLFAVPGRTGATNDWMHARGFPRRALLSAAQLRLLADEGMTIGSHTCSHARLTEVDADAAQAEIADSRRELEDLLGREVAHFAYPYGLFDPSVREMVVRAGYRSACSTRAGFNRPSEDPFLLRRLDIAGTDRPWQFRQKLRHGTHQASRWQPLAYYAGRVAARLRPDR